MKAGLCELWIVFCPAEGSMATRGRARQSTAGIYENENYLVSGHYKRREIFPGVAYEW